MKVGMKKAMTMNKNIIKIVTFKIISLNKKTKTNKTY